MKMTDCSSSLMAAHGYDPTTKTLCVRFQSGDTYHYKGVPPEVYADMVKTGSLGRFFLRNIKGKFEPTKQVVQ
jgi:hypothetical protein